MHNTLEFQQNAQPREMASVEVGTPRAAEVHYDVGQHPSVHEAEQEVSQAFNRVVAETVEQAEQHLAEHYRTAIVADTQSVINVRGAAVDAMTGE